MRRVAKSLAMALVLMGTGAASWAEAPDTTKLSAPRAELQRLYMDYLTAEGYRPQLDRDGDVQFKREGRLYFVGVSESDPEFFRLVLANFWKIESPEERAKVLVAADASNARSKVSKVFIVRDNVWACIELFVAKPADFKGVFSRSMSALQNGVGNFVTKMKE